jgi:hypothetical protein
MMFTKKKTRRPEITELSVHDGVPPRMVLTSEFDLDARTAMAEEQARIDAASGAYDRIAIEALRTLPYEQQIDDEIVMLQRSAADRLPTPSAADLEPIGSLGEAQSRRTREQQLLDGEREKRRELTRVLNGEKLTTDGVDWHGTDPAAPTGEGYFRTVLRGEVLRTWMITFGATALLLFAETYVMMRNVKMFIRGETEVFSLILALVLALIMTALPHAVGAALITSRRRGFMQAKEKWTIFLLTPIWILVGILIGLLRTEAAERHARLAAAADLEIAPDQVDLSAVFNFWIHFGLWTSIALGIGFALFAIKCLTYNPYRSQAVKLDTAMALRERRLRTLAGQDDAKARVRQMRTVEVTATFDAYRRMYGEVLPAAGQLVKSHYRTTLTRLVGRPDFTTALAISGER